MKLTSHGARALFTGIVTDSGRFRYSGVSSETFTIASKLLKYDFDFNEIYNNLYVEDLEIVKLRAEMVSKFKISEKGVAYLVYSLKIPANTQAGKAVPRLSWFSPFAWL